MNKEVLLGNFTTIMKILIITIAPSVAVYCGIDENTVIALLTAIAGLLFSLVDAKYPNTLIGGENEE